MSSSTTNESVRQRIHQLQVMVAKGDRQLADDHSNARELQAALDAIPVDSVTARTAGALRVDHPDSTTSEERAAFERAVAEENARQSEG